MRHRTKGRETALPHTVISAPSHKTARLLLSDDGHAYWLRPDGALYRVPDFKPGKEWRGQDEIDDGCPLWKGESHGTT